MRHSGIATVRNDTRTGPVQAHIPQLRVKPAVDPCQKLAGLSKLWRRAYLYQEPDSVHVILSQAELPGRDDDLVAVVGSLSGTDFEALLGYTPG